MLNFLLDAYNSVVDTPTSSFSGSSVNVEIGDNTRIYLALIIAAVLICLPIIIALIKKIFSNQNNKFMLTK